jgi:asparagine synthase (glutamine-hydrolysing)
VSAIAGVWRPHGGLVSGECDRMLAAIHLRTAECSDTWADGEIALGRKLVATVPEDRYDEQPVASPSSRYLIAADLRLDDRAGLASDLGVPPAELAQIPDSALAARCLDRWHEEAFDRLVGVFAIAAWDRQEHRLILARDFLGSRPLFFHEGERLFAFASMPAGLHALPETPKAPDYETMAEVLALFQPRSTRSHYQGVQRVLPGHYCVVKNGAVRHIRYWRPNLDLLQLKTHEDYVEGLRHHLDQAVAAQLRGSEDHVGSHLSSGFDSTAVTTSAAQLLKDRGGRVTAFTARPREGYASSLRTIVDEGPIAAATAAFHRNIEHVEVRATGRTSLDEIDRASTLYGGAIFNLCNLLWIEAILDEARRRGLKVLLTGSIGNASISYAGDAALTELFAQGRIREWLRLVGGLRRRGLTRWRGAVWNTLAPWAPGPLYMRLESLFGGPQIENARYTSLRRDRLDKLYAEAAQEGVAPGLGRQSMDYWERPRRNGQAARLGMLTADNGAIHKGILGWWGVDYRDPTADRRLVEFSLRIPTLQFTHDGHPKALIRHALAGRVPQEMLEARRKGLQGADWHEDLTRLRDRLATEVQHIAERPDTAALIDVERLQRLVTDWPSEGWEREEAFADYRLSLLRAVSVANFVRRASGSNY